MICFRQLIDNGQNKYSFPFIIINLANETFFGLKDMGFVDLIKNNDNTLTCTESIIEDSNKNKKKVIEIVNLNKMSWIPLESLNKE